MYIPIRIKNISISWHNRNLCSHYTCTHRDVNIIALCRRALNCLLVSIELPVSFFFLSYPLTKLAAEYVTASHIHQPSPINRSILAQIFFLKVICAIRLSEMHRSIIYTYIYINALSISKNLTIGCTIRKFAKFCYKTHTMTLAVLFTYNFHEKIHSKYDKRVLNVLIYL